MKTFSIFFICLSILFFNNRGRCNSSGTDSKTGNQLNDLGAKVINIMSSPELNQLATNLVDEFGKSNPEIKVNINNLSDNQINENNSIRLISEFNPESASNKSSWKMEIGHEAIVPVISIKNPMLGEIYLQGVTTEKLAEVLINPEKQKWNYLIHCLDNLPIHVYIVTNKTIQSAVSDFVKTNNDRINTINVGSIAELLSALEKDIYAIGFCRAIDIRDENSKDFLASVKILPFDKNKNNRLDSFENIYSNLEAFNRGVWIGKYPGTLCGNIYAAASAKPTDKNMQAFLSWINSKGQKYLNYSGFSHLTSIESQTNIDLLVNPDNFINQPAKPLMAKTWFIILLIFVTMGLISLGTLKVFLSQKSTQTDNEIEITPAFDENSILAPKGLYFDKSHTWAFMEKDGNVKIGLDDFLQHVTGSITRIKMKESGEQIRKGEKILSIMQNGKQLNISSPISGTIIAKNQTLLVNSTILNSEPYAGGWIYLIEPKNWLREIQFLFMSDKYTEWLQDEFIRLKDFLAYSIRSNKSVYAHVILQDGGELTDNVLADLGPEVWEDFQTNFIDTSK